MAAGRPTSAASENSIATAEGQGKKTSVQKDKGGEMRLPRADTGGGSGDEGDDARKGDGKSGRTRALEVWAGVGKKLKRIEVWVWGEDASGI